MQMSFRLKGWLLALLIIFMVTVSVPTPPLYALDPYPPCSGAFSFIGQRINVFPGSSSVQSVPARSYSWVRHAWGLNPWSAKNETEKQKFLSDATNFTLSIDGLDTALTLTICYDSDGSWTGYPDSVWKHYWIQYTPNQWNGTHTFTGYWYNVTLVLTNTITVVFLSGLGELSVFTGLPAGSVLTVIGDLALNPHGSKPSASTISRAVTRRRLVIFAVW